MDLFRSPDGHNDNRCAGLFGNVENTVVKREQFSGFASGALRIYTDRDLAALKQIRSFIDTPKPEAPGSSPGRRTKSAVISTDRGGFSLLSALFQWKISYPAPAG